MAFDVIGLRWYDRYYIDASADLLESTDILTWISKL
jgi:hypothetical protein